MKGSIGQMKDDLKVRLLKLDKIKYPLIILLAGVLLMLIPSGNSTKKTENDRDILLAEILSSTEGVGEARVLISGTGVVVACRGADSANTRMNILRAVSSYTGFTSDKITILKLT